MLNWGPIVLAFLVGAVGALGQAPWGLWPLTIAAFALCYGLFDHAISARQSAFWHWLFGAGYFAVALFWITEPFFVELERHGWMAPFALFFMSGGLALFWGLAGYIAYWIKGPIAWIAALAGAELLRSYVLSGFPWALIGHIWVGTPIAQWAQIGGAIGLTLIALVLSIFMAGLRHTSFRSGIYLVAAGLLAWFGGTALRQDIPTSPDRPIVRLSQPNAPQHQKWDRDYMGVFFDRQLSYNAKQPVPDLIIWPETSVPNLLEHASGLLNLMHQTSDGVPIIFGIQRSDTDGFYNSLVVLDENGTVGDVYDKHHLVPFGEYLPLDWLLRKFGLAKMANLFGGGYSAGAGPKLIDLGPLGKAMPLICYEAVFAQDVNGMPQRADFLIQITNDAWFGTYSGPFQHLAQARLRAIEHGLPMIRSANTGVSAVIDGNGNIVASLELNRSGFVDHPLPHSGYVTVYSLTGDWLAALAVAIMLIASTAKNATSFRKKIDPTVLSA